jgi:CheY-like chemotaxis protein
MKKSVILVDSDPESALMAQQQLQINYDVTVARSCAEALSLLSIQRPACLVFDVDLQGTSGTIMYSRVRRTPFLRDIPAVVYTNAGSRPVDFGLHTPVVSKETDRFALRNAVDAVICRQSF